MECHGKDKQAELRLDTFAELQKVIDGIPVFVAGKVGDVNCTPVILPDSDDERMPLKGNRLSDPVSDLIKR